MKVTQELYDQAVLNASAFARKRLFRKMSKTPLPKDVEKYVERFVLLYKDGPPRSTSLGEALLRKAKHESR